MASESVYLPDRKKALRTLGDVLVLGLGKSGAASAAYCLDLLGDRVASVTIAAGARNDRSQATASEMEERGARVVWGEGPLEGSFDLCIASPGISEFSDFYQSAKAVSAEIVSEVEFAWRESAADARWVAVTGTNGKTTTTSLIEHILVGAGLRARAVGNIGDTCIGAVALDGLVDMRVAEGIEAREAHRRPLEANAVGTALHAHLVPQIVERQRVAQHHPGARVIADLVHVGALGHIRHVARDDEGLALDFGSGTLNVEPQGRFGAFRQAEVARKLEEALPILGCAGEAHHHIVFHEDLGAHLGELCLQPLKALVEMGDEVLQEEVVAHARQPVGEHPAAEEV